MPRVAIKKKEYMIRDFPFWLIMEARKKGLYQKDLAGVLGITPQAFGKRMDNKKDGSPRDSFTYGELLTLFKFLDVSDEDKQKLLTL